MSEIADRLTAALSDRYRLERELGAGGMATVYLAHDLKHQRDVAIKVLHPDLGAALGGERFLSEIRTTARLQHPHILPLLDSGEADGLLYYVMPLVTGETLRARLARERQLPNADVVLIAREVADALGYAHGLGVIHRDIKPENILLQGGHALVADFGIALAVQTAGGQRMTQTGLSLGTPQYMSPEQAMGERTIDARSDIYALGAVTYEMLVGEAPFTGPSVQAIVARVLTEEPRGIGAQRKAVPPGIEDAVLRALEKLPADRFDTAKAFADALANPAPLAGTTTRQRGGASAASRRWNGMTLTFAAVAIGACGVAGWALTRTSRAPHDVGLPPTAPMLMNNIKRNFAVAHDGSFIVYEAQVGATSQLWVRSLRGPDVRAIPGTEGATGTPRISPDDQRVAFTVTGELRIVPIGGGTVATIARAGDMSGGGWLSTGQLFFSDDDGRKLRWVDPENGPGRTVPVSMCINVQPFGDGDRALCGGASTKAAYVVDPARPDTKLYLRRSRAAAAGAPLLLGADFRIVDGEYLVYMSIDGAISAVRFDNRDSLTVGKSVTLVPGVRRTAYSGVGEFDLTNDGTLVYVPGINAEKVRFVRWSSDGRVVPLNVEEATHLRFTPSPDGLRLGSVVEGIQQQELRVYDLKTGASETVEKGFFIGGPGWSPDGRKVAYRKQEYESPGRETVYLRQLDSPDAPRALIAGPYHAYEPNSYPAENFLLLGVNYKGGRVLILDPTVSPPRIDSVALSTYFVAISPDRTWIAYTNQGVPGVILQPWPAMDRRYQVDPAGGEMRWRSNRELVYSTNREGEASIKRVLIDPSSSSPVGKPELLFTDPRFAETPGWSHAIMPNGDILYLRKPAETLGYYVRVVPNWVAAMKRAVAEANR